MSNNPVSYIDPSGGWDDLPDMDKRSEEQKRRDKDRDARIGKWHSQEEKAWYEEHVRTGASPFLDASNNEWDAASLGYSIFIEQGMRYSVTHNSIGRQVSWTERNSPQEIAQYNLSMITKSVTAWISAKDLMNKEEVVESDNESDKWMARSGAVMGIFGAGIDNLRDQIKSGKTLATAKEMSNLKIASRTAMSAGLIMSFSQYSASEKKSSDKARLGGALVITATGAIPTVGPGVSVTLGTIDAAGGFDGFYNSFDNQYIREFYYNILTSQGNPMLMK